MILAQQRNRINIRRCVMSNQILCVHNDFLDKRPVNSHSVTLTVWVRRIQTRERWVNTPQMYVPVANNLQMAAGKGCLTLLQDTETLNTPVK